LYRKRAGVKEINKTLYLTYWEEENRIRHIDKNMIKIILLVMLVLFILWAWYVVENTGPNNFKNSDFDTAVKTIGNF
jgi:hypothetical protein